MISHRHFNLLTRVLIGIAALVSSLQGDLILAFFLFLAWGWIEIIIFRERVAYKESLKPQD